MTDTAPLPRPMALGEFTPFVGHMFDVDSSPKSIPIRLIEASPARYSGMGIKEPFTLIFHSTPDILLVDAIYSIKSGAFGPAAIFISSMLPPIGAAPGYYYQANFN